MSLLSSCLLEQPYSIADREWRPAWDFDNPAFQALSGAYGLFFTVVREMISVREPAWTSLGGVVKKVLGLSPALSFRGVTRKQAFYLTNLKNGENKY